MLYVSSSYQKKGIDELDIFKKLLDILPKLNLKSKKIIFKLHPSEFLSKYKNVSKKFYNSYKVKIIKDDDLEFYVKSSEAVFGCNSMALVVAINSILKVIALFIIK